MRRRGLNSEPAQKTAALTDKVLTIKLANELTYMAWVRTSLALIVYGIAIARLVASLAYDTVPYFPFVCGIVFICSGIVCFGIGIERYKWIYDMYHKGTVPSSFPQRDTPIYFVGGLGLLCTVMSLVLVLISYVAPQTQGSALIVVVST
mmetsp:Transcript_16071/g.22337  ORF Transcript_16071/g.22337 Transcript_16071/m.22337 type:complete len:149 (-) Transcript_16071:289-735(-)